MILRSEANGLLMKIYKGNFETDVRSIRPAFTSQMHFGENVEFFANPKLR